MVNVLHTALSTCYLQEIIDNPKEEPTDTELILITLDKICEEKEALWPELCRLVLLQRLEDSLVDSDEEPDYEETFGPGGPVMKSIMERLQGLKPQDYNTEFTYDEKILLLTCLIDGVHDLKAFVSILQQRVEEKTLYNREKMEIYQAIKVLE